MREPAITSTIYKSIHLERYGFFRAVFFMPFFECGDTKAYEVVRDTLGQKPKDVVETELKGDVSIQITIDD